jgi:hypothetical protein
MTKMYQNVFVVKENLGHIFPKRRNFAQSGHTGADEATDEKKQLKAAITARAVRPNFYKVAGIIFCNFMNGL